MRALSSRSTTSKESKEERESQRERTQPRSFYFFTLSSARGPASPQELPQQKFKTVAGRSFSLEKEVFGKKKRKTNRRLLAASNGRRSATSPALRQCSCRCSAAPLGLGSTVVRRSLGTRAGNAPEDDGTGKGRRRTERRRRHLPIRLLSSRKKKLIPRFLSFVSCTLHLTAHRRLCLP